MFAGYPSFRLQSVEPTLDPPRRCVRPTTPLGLMFKTKFWLCNVCSVGVDTLYFFGVRRHIPGGPMRVSSHPNRGAGSARAPLLGLIALARSSFWDAPSPP